MTAGDWIEVQDGNSSMFRQSGLQLTSGRKYTGRIHAVNGAGLVSTHESNGVTIDNTHPQVC